MEYRTLGRTGLKVSALGFGCGDVGGLMVRGTPAERERGVARALEHGINYLDTAPSYGSGESEKNLGQVLRALKPTAPAVVVGTKWRLVAADLADVAGAVARSVETSLGRLGLERVDLLHLHNLIGRVGDERPLGVARVLEAVVPAVRRLQEQGKVRFVGVTASGETGALHRALASGTIDTAQVVFNLLNPTGAYTLPAGYPAQDYDRLLVLAREQGVGTIGIRVLAGGWWPRATRPAWSRPRCVSRSPATPCPPCSSAAPTSPSSTSPPPRSTKAPSPPPPSPPSTPFGLGSGLELRHFRPGLTRLARENVVIQDLTPSSGSGRGPWGRAASGSGRSWGGRRG